MEPTPSPRFALGRGSFALLALASVATLSFGCRKQPAPKPAPPPVSNKLEIVKATWGALHEADPADVTEVVAMKIANNALTLKATPDELGDPASMKIKQLRVRYKKSGVVSEKHVGEGEILSIPADEKPVPIRLVVTKAVYGNLEKEKTVDVTLRVADMVKNNELSVTPTNVLFGDPAKRMMKQLRVDYTLDGKQMSKTVDEGQTLDLSAGDS
jgi:ribosomal 50S subunit-recycling heat shock protein